MDVGLVAHDKLSDIRTSEPGGLGHADELETSHALYMNPELVDMELGEVRMSNPNPEWLTGHHHVDPAIDAPRIHFPKTVEEYKKSAGDQGQIGDPTAATADKGRAFHEAVVGRLVDAIAYLKKVPLDIKCRPAPFD